MKFSVLVVAVLMCGTALAQSPPAPPDAARIQAARDKGIAFLRATQADDGTWSGKDSTGISALAAYGLLVSGVPTSDPVVAKTLKRLLELQQPDGRICAATSRIPGYESAIALMTLATADKLAANHPYKEQITKAEKFVRGLQLDETRNLKESDSSYGGTGYGPDGGRSDLSNTSFFLDALEAAGVSGSDPAVQKARAFVLRCQACEDTIPLVPGATAANEGGFAYTPITAATAGGGRGGRGGRGEAAAPADPRSVLYGSMGYAGLKSMLYSGLTADDPRVVRTTNWIKRNYTVTENPGIGANGLFYYYQMFGKALHQWNVKEIVDDKGVAHNWQADLSNQLISLQKENGSWVNTSPQWQESDPNLATAFSLIALSYCAPVGGK